MEALAAYRDAGDHVVVVTGAPAELVKIILAADSSDPVHVVGSTSRHCMGGLILERHCYGAHKLAMLYDCGYTAPLVIVYSDNPADFPLLVRAIKPILVNPRASRVAAFRRVLGADVEIQSW
nr:haloacid dehalogenase-like hydrolase [Mycobacterium marinum]